MSNGKNVRVGHGYEREVKDMFVKARWGCTRAARSASAMDLIAFRQPPGYSVAYVFQENGYTIKNSKSTKIPLYNMASKVDGKYIKRTYYDLVSDGRWTVVLMQCKIGER